MVTMRDSIAIAGYQDGTVLFWNADRGDIQAVGPRDYSTWTGDSSSDFLHGRAESAPLGGTDEIVPSNEAEKRTKEDDGEVVAVRVYDDFLLACYWPIKICLWTRGGEPVLEREQQMEALDHIQNCGDVLLHRKAGPLHSHLEGFLLERSVSARGLMDPSLSIDGDAAGNVTAGTVIDSAPGVRLTGILNGLHRGRVNAVAIEGEVVASVSDDETIRLWNHRTFEVIGQPMYGHEGPVLSVDISKDFIVSGGEDTTVRVWQRGSVLPIGRAQLAADDRIHALAIAGDVVCTGHNDGTVRLWDRDTGEPVGSPFRAEWVWRWDGESEEQRATASEVHARRRDRSWHPSKAALPAQIVNQQQPQSGITSVTANESFVVAGHQDGTIWLWDRASGDQILKSYSDPYCSFNDVGAVVTALAVSDDNLLAIGDVRGRVYFWDLNQYKRLDTMGHTFDAEENTPHSSFVHSFTILNDHIVSISHDNTICLWDRRTSQPIGAAHQVGPPCHGVPVVSDAFLRRNESTREVEVLFPFLPDIRTEDLATELGSNVILAMYKTPAFMFFVNAASCELTQRSMMALIHRRPHSFLPYCPREEREAGRNASCLSPNRYGGGIIY